MFARLPGVLSIFAILSVLSTGFLSAQALKKKEDRKVKDQGEHDVYTEVTKTTDPAKRLQLLDTWKQKYPDTDYKDTRLEIYLITYQALGQVPKMAETAKELLAMDPGNVNGLYWLTLLTPNLPATPENLATGEKAARGLLEAKRPEAVTEDAWKGLKTEVLAHKTLGYVAAARKDYATAEKQYAKVLELNPNFAEVSYALGMVILSQKNPDRQSEMLYHWARAASLSGVGQLEPPDQKKKIDAFFVKFYHTYHGSDEGLKELRATSLAAPMPPAGFKIESKDEIETKNAEKIAKERPEYALWMNIRRELKEKGEPYFESNLKGTAPPKLKGWVVATKPALRPKEIQVAMENKDAAAEVTLKLETAMPGKADPGTEIEFQGVPSAFTKEPFMVTFDVESKDKISGWPAAAPVRKAPAGTRKGATKKGATKKKG